MSLARIEKRTRNLILNRWGEETMARSDKSRKEYGKQTFVPGVLGPLASLLDLIWYTSGPSFATIWQATSFAVDPDVQGRSENLAYSSRPHSRQSQYHSRFVRRSPFGIARIVRFHHFVSWRSAHKNPGKPSKIPDCGYNESLSARRNPQRSKFGALHKTKEPTHIEMR